MPKITKERLAEILNGREYRDEITEDEKKEAKEAWLIVVFWYSDDNVILNWAIDDEIWAWGWTSFYIRWNHLLKLETLDEVLDSLDDYEWYLRWLANKDLESSKLIKAHDDKDWYTWFIETELSHSTFDIMEDWEKFCRGIIIDKNDLWIS